MPTRLAVRGAVSRGVFALVVVVSLGVLFAPADDVPAALPGVDKLVHAALFAALAASGRWAGGRPALLAVGLAGYGAVSEVLQAVTPLSRTGSLADLLADLVGVALGLAAWAALHRRTAPGTVSR